MPRQLITASILLGVAICIALTSCSSNQAPPPEAGWCRTTWNAGKGSWAFGGMGVCYTVDLPPGYTISEKLGSGWISNQKQDDVISMEFWTDAMSQPTTMRELDGRTSQMVLDPREGFEKFQKIHNELAAKHPEQFEVCEKIVGTLRKG